MGPTWSSLHPYALEESLHDGSFMALYWALIGSLLGPYWVLIGPNSGTLIGKPNRVTLTSETLTVSHTGSYWAPIFATLTSVTCLAATLQRIGPQGPIPGPLS